MTKDEALRMALEAFGGNDWHDEIVDSAWADKANKAITAIKEALAQPEQEPFAYINVEKRRLEFAHDYVKWDTPTTIKLDKIPLYTTPPQRKPLTIEDVKIIWQNLDAREGVIMGLVRAVEAAHDIKENT